MAQEPFDSAWVRPIVSIFGLAQGLITSLLSATPSVTYAVDAGMIIATGVVNCYPTTVAGLILMVMSTLRPVIGFLAAMPKPVAGAILLGIEGRAIGANLSRTETSQLGHPRPSSLASPCSVLWAGNPWAPISWPDSRAGYLIFDNPVITPLVHVIALEQLVFRRQSVGG